MIRLFSMTLPFLRESSLHPGRKVFAPMAAAVLIGSLLTASPVHALSADSLRQEVSRLASQGRLDEALDQVDRNAAELPSSWNAMFRGKLELEGAASSRGYKNASGDSAPPQMRGEALFRQAQYQYAGGKYSLAIPLFREYLVRYPSGPWSEPSSYWLAYSCIQMVKRGGRDAYLDTAQSYLRKLEFKGRDGYYWPLARAAQARVLLMRGDTVGAQRAARDARSKAPAEETPGILLLSLQAEPQATAAGAWDDSLRWSYPLSPETRLLASSAVAARPAAPAAASQPPATSKAAHVPAVSSASAASGAFALQLGVFSKESNAQRFVKTLGAKNIACRIATMPGRTTPLYRVLYGSFASDAAAAAEGKRVLKPGGFDYRVVEP